MEGPKDKPQAEVTKEKIELSKEKIDAFLEELYDYWKRRYHVENEKGEKYTEAAKKVQNAVSAYIYRLSAVKKSIPKVEALGFTVVIHTEQPSGDYPPGIRVTLERNGKQLELCNLLRVPGGSDDANGRAVGYVSGVEAGLEFFSKIGKEQK